MTKTHVVTVTRPNGEVVSVVSYVDKNDTKYLVKVNGVARHSGLSHEGVVKTLAMYLAT